ncbi:hypothetical protein AB0B94_30795 [Micromonospora sp. NPDC048986]|uniref:hypothetical protein n=1 Tax=Micromonospora sp. NPDC048986 TaxID=3155644 RepID=UPI0033F1B367
MTTPRITSIALDENEMPDAITVLLPVRHAATIVQKFGALSRATGGTEETSDLYDCLNSLFNTFWEGRVNDYLSDRADDR